MTSVICLLRQLEAYVQDEIGAQGRTLALLSAQADALRGGDPQQIVTGSQQLERELHSTPQRARRRDELLSALCKLWSLAPHTLTLASIAERVGDEGERLRRQCSELRELAALVARAAQRNATVARVQERFNADVLGVLLATEQGQPLESRGALVNAEA